MTIEVQHNGGGTNGGGRVHADQNGYMSITGSFGGGVTYMRNLANALLEVVDKVESGS